MPKVAKEIKNPGEVTIVADGAAIGAQIEQLVLAREVRGISLFLPESFEYMLLHSSMFGEDVEIQCAIKEPEKVITAEYKSYEDFYTQLIMSKTKDLFEARYMKKNLPKCYTEECCPYWYKCKYECGVKDKVEDIISKFQVDKSDDTCPKCGKILVKLSTGAFCQFCNYKRQSSD